MAVVSRPGSAPDSAADSGLQEMARRRIYTNGTFKATLAHSDIDIRETEIAAVEAL